MRRIALLVLTPWLWASTATAETTDGEASPTAVRAKLDGTSARLTAEYRIHTTDPATLVTTEVNLPLPAGGVVVGATIAHAGVTHRLALDTAQRVEERFMAAFGDDEAPGTPTTWVAKVALSVDWGTTPSVTASIAAPIETDVVLSLEIVAPTCFAGDLRYVRAPLAWQRAVHGRPPVAAVRECTARRDDGTEAAWIAFPAPEAARRATGDRFAVATARLAVDAELHLARTELAVAATIADVPRDLVSVILVDESRSLTDAQRRSQRELVLGYVRAAPAGRVQVIAFARRARTLLPAWMTAVQARARLERELASLTPRNGSNFDVALADAGRLLAQTTGTRRVLLVTDEAMASRLAEDPAKLADLVPAGTIINVAVVDGTGDTDDEGNAIVARDDDVRLAPLAATTTGVSARLADLDPARRTPVDATMLVRPMSLDHVQATGLGWTDVDPSARESLLGSTCAGTVAAGQSCVWWTKGSRFSTTIQIEGLLWNQRVVHVVRPLGDPGMTIAREIVGTATQLHVADDGDPRGADRDQQLSVKIDALARAVTPSTSLFVQWGGNALYAGGLLRGGMGGVGRAGIIDGIGSRGPGSRGTPELDLRSQLRPLVEHCKLGTRHTVVALELTRQEIVHVDVAPIADDAGDVTRRCIEEAAWMFEPLLPTLEPFRTASVNL